MAFNCIHDMVHPRAAPTGTWRALKPGGVVLWSEADAADQLEENFTPIGRTLYGASTMHCMAVSPAHGGEGLGSVIGEKLVREVGFSDFERLPVKNPYHQIFAIRKYLGKAWDRWNAPDWRWKPRAALSLRQPPRPWTLYAQPLLSGTK